MASLQTYFKKRKTGKMRRNLRNDRFAASYPVSEDLSSFGEVIREIAERDNRMGAAKIFSDADGIVQKKVPEKPALKVEVAVVRDSFILPQTDGFLKHEIVFHPDILKHEDGRHDFKNKTLKLSVCGKRPQVNFPKGLSYSIKIPGYTISLVKEHSFNYYHFIYECLPKLIAVGECVNDGCLSNENSFDWINILIDEDVPDQCVEYIDRVIDFPYKLHRLSKCEIIQCESLIYCSPFFHAMDNTAAPVFDVNDFYVDRGAVALVRSKFEMGSVLLEKPGRLIYLERRPNLVRQIINASEVKELLLRFGFEAVFADEYSLEEQINIFVNAKCIVGSSGAAFANLIHMQPGTAAVIFSPDLTLTNHFLFQQQADVSGVNLIHINAKSESATKTLHDDTYVDVGLLAKLLTEAVGLVEAVV